MADGEAFEDDLFADLYVAYRSFIEAEMLDLSFTYCGLHFLEVAPLDSAG